MVQTVWTFIDHYIRRAARDERDVAAIEDGLIAALIAVGIIPALGPAGDAKKAIFVEIEKALSNVASPFP